MKKLFAALLIVAVGLIASACGDDDAVVDETAPDETVPDETVPDETVPDETVPEESAPPEDQRIVSLSSTATETLFAIGAGEDVVAVDAFSNYPEEAPITDLDGFTPNVEAIAAYEPTLVTMQANAPETAEALEALGITVIARDAPADFDGIYAQIEELGAATGHVADAAELVLAMQTDIAEFQAEAPEATGVTYYHELGTDYFSLNRDTFIAEVYGLFGLTSIGDAADGEAFAGYLQLTEEYILGADPDLIFLADTKYASQSAETVAARPGWGELSAVRNGAVVELDDDVASRWGPRVVEFAGQIAAALEGVAAPA